MRASLDQSETRTGRPQPYDDWEAFWQVCGMSSGRRPVQVAGKLVGLWQAPGGLATGALECFQSA